MTVSETPDTHDGRRGGPETGRAAAASASARRGRKRNGRSLLGIASVATFAFVGAVYWLVRAEPASEAEGYAPAREATAASNGAQLAAPAPAQGEIELRRVGLGFREVTEIQFVPGSDDTAIVFEKAGIARLATFGNQEVRAEACPTLFQLKVRTRSELGLLGLAYHPQFTANGLFYVNYNPEEGSLRTVISEWKTDPKALATTEAQETRTLLEIQQPYPNHDGGGLAFGPDGMLYIGMGDGGAGGDPLGHGQKLETLLGAMLRIDVNRRDEGRQYGIPKDNPFVARSDARPEIWAYGLRNPWRFTFTPSGALIAADVGQNSWEEVSIVPKGGNMGWAAYEGSHCFKQDARCGKGQFVPPIFEYGRDKGGSITGGFVYLGAAIPELKGKYVFADYLSGRMWAIDVPDKPGVRVQGRELGEWSRSISTFGRSASGELYVGDLARGEILRLVRR